MKAKKRRGPVFRKLDRDYITRLGVIKKPTLDYSWRRGAHVSDLPSREDSGTMTPFRSVMDPVSLEKENPETRAEIISKSKRIAPAYNKGASQYLSDETDPKTIGRK